jgi:hypothetical protein
LLPKVAAFPRAYRFTLGDRVVTAGLDMLDLLLVARFRPRERAAALEDANVRLERLRYLLRLARELQCLSLAEYEHAARLVVPMGRQVGGWLRHAHATSAPDRQGRARGHAPE